MTLLPAIAALLLPSGARAQDLEPRHVKPVHVHTDLSGYRSATWDTRVFVTAGSGGWGVKVFRPEAVTVDGSGVPNLDGTCSDEVPLERDDNRSSGMGDPNKLTLRPFSEGGE